MNIKRDNGKSFFRLTAGWSALLLYVAACSPVGLDLAALVGSLDADHQILLAAGERGGRMVLHHGARCAAHHHGAVAKALTVFAQPTNPADPDHVLQFSSVDSLKSHGKTAVPQPQSEGQFVAFGPGEDDSLTLPVCVSRISLHPLPGESGALRCLRSTVLLI